MTATNRIILTGFSGTGKSAVGPLLAKALGWELVDTDAIVEERAGKRILEIFRDDGEVAFRDLEVDALRRRLLARERVVISTGGGVVLRAENRRAMAEAGFVVCLEARPETIIARLHASRGRRAARPAAARDRGPARPHPGTEGGATAPLRALRLGGAHRRPHAGGGRRAEIIRAYNERSAEALASAGARRRDQR